MNKLSLMLKKFLIIGLVVAIPKIAFGVLCDKDGCISGDYDVGYDGIFLSGFTTDLIIVIGVIFVVVIIFFIIKFIIKKTNAKQNPKT